MRSRSDKFSLTAPLVASLFVHLGAAALSERWRLHAPREASVSDSIEMAVLPPEEPSLLPPPEEPDPVVLGLAEATAPSGAWLGFESSTEHIAEPSEVDQPELSLDPPTGPVTESLASAPESAVPLETASAPESGASPPASPIVPKTPTLPPPPVEPSGETLPSEEERGPIDPPLKSAAESAEQQPQVDEREAQEIKPVPAVPPAPAPTPPARRTAPEPRPQPPTPSGSGATGSQSDRESTAASILTAEWKKLGQPLAGKGLEIKTRRPKFTQYTRIMGAARNPIVRVHFRRDGLVERVDVLQSSGNADVDRPVIDAIYQWRATGEALSKIPTPSPPATYPVEFRILM